MMSVCLIHVYIHSMILLPVRGIPFWYIENTLKLNLTVWVWLCIARFSWHELSYTHAHSLDTHFSLCICMMVHRHTYTTYQIPNTTTYVLNDGTDILRKRFMFAFTCASRSFVSSIQVEWIKQEKDDLQQDRNILKAGRSVYANY